MNFLPEEKSAALFQRSLLSIPGAVNSPVRAFGSVGGTPRFITKAHGPYIKDADDNTYVDLVCSWGPALLGHGFPEVIRAVQKTAERGLSFGAPTENEVALAEAITARVPAAEKIRLVSTGTEATMTAIRLARGATNRRFIVKFAGCYHGHSDGLLVAAGSGVATQGLPGSAGVTEGIAGDTLVCPYNDKDALTKLFDQHGDDIAGVITEAAPANMGIVAPKDDFNLYIRDITRRHGALMIFDEVLTGFRVGPSGYWGLDAHYEPQGLPAHLPDFMADDNPKQARHQWVSDQLSSTRYQPDIFTFGKVIGGGMPLAAIGGRAEIMDELAPVGPVYQAGTLSGNPLATAAGLVTLEAADLLIYTRINTVSEVIQNMLRQAFDSRGIPYCLNNVGNLFSVFFGSEVAESGVWNYEDAQRQDTHMYNVFFHSMLEHGVALPPSGFEAWFVSSSHDDRSVGVISEAIDHAANDLVETLE